MALLEDEILMSFLEEIKQSESFKERMEGYLSAYKNDSLFPESITSKLMEMSEKEQALSDRDQGLRNMDIAGMIRNQSMSPRGVEPKETPVIGPSIDPTWTDAPDSVLKGKFEKDPLLTDKQMKDISGVLNAGAMIMGGKQREKYDYDADIANQQATWSTLKQGIGMATGPVGGLIAAGSEFGKAIGGDFLGSVLDPISAPLEVMNNSDATSSEKALSIVPGLGGLVAKKVRSRTKARIGREQGEKRFKESRASLNRAYSQKEHQSQMEALEKLNQKQNKYS